MNTPRTEKVAEELGLRKVMTIRSLRIHRGLTPIDTQLTFTRDNPKVFERSARGG